MCPEAVSQSRCHVRASGGQIGLLAEILRQVDTLGLASLGEGEQLHVAQPNGRLRHVAALRVGEVEDEVFPPTPDVAAATGREESGDATTIEDVRKPPFSAMKKTKVLAAMPSRSMAASTLADSLIEILGDRQRGDPHGDGIACGSILRPRLLPSILGGMKGVSRELREKRLAGRPALCHEGGGTLGHADGVLALAVPLEPAIPGCRWRMSTPTCCRLYARPA